MIDKLGYLEGTRIMVDSIQERYQFTAPIKFSDFKNLVIEALEHDMQQVIRQSFIKFDIANDDSITVKELR